MKKNLAISFLALAALFMFSVAAEAGVINIKNATGFDIHEIYISDSGTSSWEEDVMGNDVLANGQALRLTVNGAFSKFDMRAVSPSGDSCDWFELPGNATSITIFADGTASYQ